MYNFPMSKLHLVPPPSLNQFCSKPHLITRAPGLASSPDLANSTAATHHLLSQGEPAKSISKTMQVHTLHEGRSRDTNYSAFNETKPDPFVSARGKGATLCQKHRGGFFGFPLVAVVRGRSVFPPEDISFGKPSC